MWLPMFPTLSEAMSGTPDHRSKFSALWHGQCWWVHGLGPEHLAPLHPHQGRRWNVLQDGPPPPPPYSFEYADVKEVPSSLRVSPEAAVVHRSTPIPSPGSSSSSSRVTPWAAVANFGNLLQVTWTKPQWGQPLQSSGASHADTMLDTPDVSQILDYEVGDRCAAAAASADFGGQEVQQVSQQVEAVRETAEQLQKEWLYGSAAAAELPRELYDRWKEEQYDRLVAERLQKEFDDEVCQRDVDDWRAFRAAAQAERLDEESMEVCDQSDQGDHGTHGRGGEDTVHNLPSSPAEYPPRRPRGNAAERFYLSRIPGYGQCKPVLPIKEESESISILDVDDICGGSLEISASGSASASSRAEVFSNRSFSLASSNVDMAPLGGSSSGDSTAPSLWDAYGPWGPGR